MSEGSWTLEHHDTLESTNDRLRHLARHGAADRTVVVARRQTGGRGRGDNPWESPEGGLYLSVLLREVPVTAAPLLPLVAGEALVRTLEALRVPVAAWLKWPNDLLIGPPDARAPVGKAAGILVETVSRGDRIDNAVIGLGINLHTDPHRLPTDLDPPAVSLRDAMATCPHGDLFLDVLLSRLETVTRLAALAPERLIQAVERRLAWRGETVQVTLGDGATTRGRVIGLAADGALRIDVDDHERALHAWDVAHLRRA